MKPFGTLAAICTMMLLCNCSSNSVKPPVHAPSDGNSKMKKPVPASAGGVLRQVAPAPAKPKDKDDSAKPKNKDSSKPKNKDSPDIPVKDDTGTSPLIHDAPDTPAYKRSSS